MDVVPPSPHCDRFSEKYFGMKGLKETNAMHGSYFYVGNVLESEMWLIWLTWCPLSLTL